VKSLIVNPNGAMLGFTKLPFTANLQSAKGLLVPRRASTPLREQAFAERSRSADDRSQALSVDKAPPGVG